VGYRMAYGTDKHDDYFGEMAAKARSGSLSVAETVHLREELDAMAGRGTLQPALRDLRNELDALLAKARADAAAAAAPKA
jgi:hypothetical protein